MYNKKRKLNMQESEISLLEWKARNFFDNHGPSLSILILHAEITHSYDNCSNPKDTEQ